MEWPNETVEQQAACDAATAAAFTTTDDDGVEQSILHSFAHSGPIAIGADAMLGDVLYDIENADEVLWVSHPLKHDLAVRRSDRVRYYAVPRPERS